jgi:hypothetical protein
VAELAADQSVSAQAGSRTTRLRQELTGSPDQPLCSPMISPALNCPLYMKLCPTAARALGGWHKTTPRPFLTALLLVILSGCFSSQQAPMLMPPASPGTQQSGGEQTTVTQAAEECVKCGPQAYYKREIENGGQNSCFAALSDSDLGDEMERACGVDEHSRLCNATIFAVLTRDNAAYFSWFMRVAEPDALASCSGIRPSEAHDTCVSRATLKLLDNQPAELQRLNNLAQKGKEIQVRGTIDDLASCVGTPTAECKTFAAQELSTLSQPRTSAS